MLNNIDIMGRITKDIEVKTLDSGSKVTNFTIACDRADKDRTTDFIPCVAWGTKADFIGKWFKKGSPIIITGRLQTRKYEKNGETRVAFEIIVSNCEFAPSTTRTESDDEMGVDFG